MWDITNAHNISVGKILRSNVTLEAQKWGGEGRGGAGK